MSQFDEAIEVLQRIESSAAAKEARKPVKGTFIVDGDEIVHSSFDKTTTQELNLALARLIASCSNCIRSLDPTDNVEFIRVNTEGRRNVRNCRELMLATDGAVQMVVVQEHQLRDLSKRSPFKAERIIAGYQYDQEDFFFPTLRSDVPPPASTTATNEA